MRYYIYNSKENGFWTHDFGWGGFREATIYSEEERQTFNLPIDGQWIPVAHLMKTLLLLEHDGDTLRIHGVMQAPVNHTDATIELDGQIARDEAREKNPDEWNYADVIAILEAKGYVSLDHILSYE